MTAKPTATLTCEPNVTPMLDVLLVLLIVFMSVSIPIIRTINVGLPEPCVGACGSSQQIVLEVLPGPHYRINQAPVERPELLGRLTGIYSGRPDKTIQVAGYPGVSYNAVMNAIDVAKSAGVRVVGIAPKDSYLRR